jgi:methionine synthase I (cobalamin-dependent)
MNRLVEALHSGRVLVMDGAMGTELQRLGLRDDECSVLWNLTHPEEVGRVHMAYLEAGAEVLLTNTFLVYPDALARFGLTDRSRAIWDAAHEIARIFPEPRPLVLTDLGPMPPRECLVVSEWCRRLSGDGLLLETQAAHDPDRSHCLG